MPIIKTKSATLLFHIFSSFPLPRSSLLPFPFPSLLRFYSLSGEKTLPFYCGPFSLKWVKISLDSFSKNRLVRYMCKIRRASDEKRKKITVDPLLVLYGRLYHPILVTLDLPSFHQRQSFQWTVNGL